MFLRPIGGRFCQGPHAGVWTTGRVAISGAFSGAARAHPSASHSVRSQSFISSQEKSRGPVVVNGYECTLEHQPHIVCSGDE